MTININSEDSIYDLHSFVPNSEEVGIEGFYLYECEHCGLRAKRYPQTETLTILEGDEDMISVCE